MKKEQMERKQGALGPDQRWSARRKREVVLRLLRDDDGDWTTLAWAAVDVGSGSVGTFVYAPLARSARLVEGETYALVARETGDYQGMTGSTDAHGVIDSESYGVISITTSEELESWSAGNGCRVNLKFQ